MGKQQTEYEPRYRRQRPSEPDCAVYKFRSGDSSRAGYNFNRQNALVGEFLWNRLNPTPKK